MAAKISYRRSRHRARRPSYPPSDATRVRADADARIDAEHSARVAAQGHVDAVTGERDRLVAQLAALSAELAALRKLMVTPAIPVRESDGAVRSRAPRRSRVHRPIG